MKVFIHGFWNGFAERTDPIHCGFFIDVFTQIFKENIEIGTTVNDCHILLESVFSKETRLFDKEWENSFLFYGESTLHAINHCGQERWNNRSKYTCVLGGERNHGNVINMPLFVPYIYCNNMVNRLHEKNEQHVTSYNKPIKSICAIISNPGGSIRNQFLEKLEQHVSIDYAGSYKNNVSRINGSYNSPELLDFISQYKFIISMENSCEETYITEKIIHGLLAQTIPVYWGSERIHDYFNADRFLFLENNDVSSMDLVISRIIELMNDDAKYQTALSKPIFAKNCHGNYENARTMDIICSDIEHLLCSNVFPFISKTFIISSPEFELTRYNKMKDVFHNNLGMAYHNIQFICPTYKEMITDEMMKYHVKDDQCHRYERGPLLKSELSLFLNHLEVLKQIEKNYSDGMFLVVESDVIPMETISQFNDFLTMVQSKRNDDGTYCWDMINLGCPYGEKMYSTWYEEDITSENDPFRLLRKKFTRCTDSILWSYTGVKKILDLLKVENNYCLPIDTWIDDIIAEKYPEFKLYWSVTSFFLQETFCSGTPSTIR